MDVARSQGVRTAMTYVLPIRARTRIPDELLSYLAGLTRLETLAEIIVVDGSPPDVFADAEARRPPGVLHVHVDADLRRFANGKVAGVVTGLRRASQDMVVIADDDVHHDEQTLEAMQLALGNAAIVRPQNYFEPLPWHACLDTARTLINRVSGGDWPGTFGLRRNAIDWCEGYGGNVLFENLELVRTVKARGGSESCRLNLFVRRLPPSGAHFFSQRIRQAYDEFARPGRLAVWLLMGPLIVMSIIRLGWWGVALAIAAPMAVAEVGRRIGEGARVFPFRATLVAPLWTIERAICSWLAVGSRLLLGGIPYHGRILRAAATPRRTLARKHARRGRIGAGVL
jgi:hypothetical protein